MSASRREVFQTSVITALGAAAGAAIGFAFGKERTPAQRRLLFTLAGSVVAVYDTNTTSWFFFSFDSNDPHNITMYNYANKGNPGGTSAAPTNINLTDTASWLGSLNLKPVPDSNTTTKISYLNNSGHGSIQVSIKNGILRSDDGSIASLLNALLDMKQIPGSWNEIGHN